MIGIGGLWKNTSKDGKEYLSGNFGDAKILIFPNDKKGNEKAPDYRMVLAEKTKKNPTSQNSEDVPF